MNSATTRILIVLLALAALSSPLFSEGVSERRGLSPEEFSQINGFSRVINESPADIRITLEEPFSIRFEGSSESRENMYITQDGDEIRILQRPGRINRGFRGSATLYISMPRLEYLHNGGTGDAAVQGVIRNSSLEIINSGTGDLAAQARVEEFSAVLSGTGDMDLRVISEEADIRLTGTGDCRIALVSRNSSLTLTGVGDILAEGESERANLRLTGAGAFRGRNFSVDELSAALTGAGSALLRVREEIDARLTGVGNLSVIGSAEITELVQTGIGRLVRID